MRLTYRTHGGNRSYWQARWDDVDVDTGELNLRRYPGQYANNLMTMTDGLVLEAGCGAGRVLRYYHQRGRAIVGMDFIATVLQKIRSRDPDIPLVAGDVMNMSFPEKIFSGVLAFGLYHNLEHGFDRALLETRRILIADGLLCASLRADNVQNRITDWLADRRATKSGPRIFHKANYSIGEIRQIFARNGFDILKIEFVENMPFLYKFPVFRHKTHRQFNEQLGRAQGYRLSALGAWLQKLLFGFWPSSFCNIFVVTARAADRAQ